MTMLAERVDAVIGVDTHTDTHTAAVCDARGGVLCEITVSTTAAGYRELVAAAAAHAPGRRLVWAIEGSGSYGRALVRDLRDADAEVVEVRAARRARGQSKTDATDAVAIARGALAAVHPAVPRGGDVREALRLLSVARAADVATRTRVINAFKAVVLGAPDAIRARLRDRSTTAQLSVAATLDADLGVDLRDAGDAGDADQTTRACVQVLSAYAAQVAALNTAIKAAEARLDTLTDTHAAPLRAEPGIGPVSAATILITWSHPGRFRSEAAFAAIAGTSPLQASSGRTTRHRLNRSGDRQLNAALHRIVLTRRRTQHDATTDYVTRRTHDGKTDREINRCLKRYLARHIHRVLHTMPAMP